MDSLNQAEAEGRLRPYRSVLLFGVPAALIVAALAYTWIGTSSVSTDDAYIQIAKVEVSANISARVADIAVKDNQRVHKGDVLVKLEPERFAIATREAEAQLAAARQKIQSLKAAYHERLADEKAAANDVTFRQSEFARQTKLEQSGISSRAQLERSENDLASARQKLQAAQSQSQSALSDLGGEPDAPIDNQPGVRAAEAALDRAKLELGYTVLSAPMDGIVAKVGQLQPGNFVQSGQPLFALISDKDVWVEANFKETDLSDLRPGQQADMTVDAYPGVNFAGRVESTSPGTGSSFSLLPPENSSGNWVKVVQRLPVRLSIDPGPADKPLAAGMSVNVKVDTGRRRSLWPWD